jgi:hypothetical protein
MQVSKDKQKSNYDKTEKMLLVLSINESVQKQQQKRQNAGKILLVINSARSYN